MTLFFNTEEKNEMKGVIRSMMVKFRDELTEAISDFDEYYPEGKELDDDVDC